jgi:uncharacterized membrane protein
VDIYALVKALHIISATVLFGTGIGTAFFFWSSRNADDASRLFAARTTVRADYLFTLPAVVRSTQRGSTVSGGSGSHSAGRRSADFYSSFT